MSANTPALLAEAAYQTAQWAEPRWYDLGTVLGMKLKRRRGRLRGKYEAGTCTLLLDNRDGSKDLLNPSSIFGAIPEDHRVRLRGAIPSTDVNLLTPWQYGAELPQTGYWAGLTNTTVARSTAQADSGAASWAITATAAGDAVAATEGGSGGWLSTLGVVEIAQGRRYNAMAQVRPSAARTVTLAIHWLAVGGGLISIAPTAPVAVAAGAWASVAVPLAIPPPTAAYARLLVTVTGCAAGEVTYLDTVALGSNIATAQPPSTIIPIFDGYHEACENIWPDPASAVAQLTLVDIFGPLARGRLGSDTYRAMARATVPAPFRYSRMGQAVTPPSSWPDEMGSGVVGASAYNPGTLGAVAPALVPGALVTDDNGANDAMQNGGLGLTLPSPGYGDFGVEFWMRVAGSTTGGGATSSILYCYSTLSGQYHVWRLKITSGGGLQMFVGSTGALVDSTTGPVTSVVVDALWHHVLLTRTTGTTWRIYVDGVLAATMVAAVNVNTANAIFLQFPGENSLPCQIDEVLTFQSAPNIADYTARYNEGRGKWGRMLSHSRVSLVAQLAGIPSQLLDIGAGVEYVEAVDGNLSKTPPLTHMQEVETAEGGDLYASKAGKLTFRGRTQTPKAITTIYGDNPAELPYVAPPRGSRDNLDVLDQVAITPARGSQVVDAAPASTAMVRTEAITTIAYNDPLRVAGAAKRRRLSRAIPLMRLTQLVLDPGANPAMQPVVLGHEIDDGVTVRRRPVGAPMWSVDAVVEGYEHDVTPESWRTTLDLGGRYVPPPQGAHIQGRAMNVLSGVYTPIPLFDAWDETGGFTSSQFPTRLVVSDPGVYLVVANAGVGGASAATSIRLNGATFLSWQYLSTVNLSGTSRTLWRCVPGDYFELISYQASGVAQALLVQSGYSPNLSIVRLGD